MGVPEGEVELALVNGSSVGLARNLKPGDRVSLYPVFESFDVKPALRIRNKPLRKTRFLVEPQLRRLAFYLRMLGFDAPVDSRTGNAEENRRIVLTADSELLKSGLPRVYVVRERKPGRQLKEVLSRFDLCSVFSVFLPCSPCFMTGPTFHALDFQHIVTLAVIVVACLLLVWKARTGGVRKWLGVLWDFSC